MTKKGVSPLIATVLIIGFTIALAALIMTWGTTFIKKTQKDVEIGAEAQLQCAKVDLALKSHNCDALPALNTLDVESKYQEEMVVWVRHNSVKLVPVVPFGVPAYSVATLNLGVVLSAGDELEVIPVLKTEDGVENVCIQSSQKVVLDCV